MTEEIRKAEKEEKNAMIKKNGRRVLAEGRSIQSHGNAAHDCIFRGYGSGKRSRAEKADRIRRDRRWGQE